ncbi:hypothetical protein DPV79_23635 [Burkholderia reimsis]|uniref:DUF4410 domain-containing protein n=1 Tax=Burkholderia reimsis TaxID=2234132 RepID=A0A365QRD6_9BURK|nr:hypothetical protein [Burkholderia reimsis]RBB36994.1 hypothetical protein DPV79_23635 [Burkholderia reimsis]
MIKDFRIARFSVAIGLTLSLSACLAPHSYVDQSLGEPHYADLKKSASPQPIQLLVEFQTKGVANAQATEALRPRVFEQVSQSGLFSRVSYDPVPSGRKLSITLNNVPLTDNVAAKGFGTGLTFGLIGTMVTDGYICTTNYLEPGHEPVTTTVKHAIHTTIGNASGPEGLQRMSVQEASATMLRQIVGKSLEQIDQASDLAQ